MNTPYVRAPHQEGSGAPNQGAPNAALLIDFDNVTMGMRSDLSNELKTLLNSDIIKGKVAVQRAYADWRRYPQYIVPLSEASIDLIFAPAYGSNKKNATDIRMAIDGMELVFTRPEIGTFILLTGDSDFSSLVLKLKEYGKYVIGVGIKESSSDILVQNCDEYYSYTSLAGLRKTTDADTEAVDPWLLVEKALSRMQSRNDVMRSDRLKQVMLEIDSGFDESEYGFSKFSRFLTEAASRDLVDLKRMENGQYEVRPTKGGSGRGGSGDGGRGGGRTESSRSGDGRGRKESKEAAAPESPPSGGGRTRGRATRARTRGGRDRSEGAEREERKKSAPSGGREKAAAESGAAQKDEGDPLQEAYDLLTSAVERLTRERDIPAVRDSDVKRKMLEADRSFDEAELGFSKFSLFLQQADEHEVILLRKRESGNYEVGLPGAEVEEDATGAPEDGGASEEAGTAAAAEQARKGREEKETEEPAAEEEEQEEEDEVRAADQETERRNVQEILDRHRVSSRSEPAASRAGAEEGAEEGAPEKVRAEKEEAEEAEGAEEKVAEAETAASGPEKAPTSSGRGLGPRRGERPGRRGRKEKSGPPILPGQIVQKGSSGTGGTSSPSDDGPGAGAAVGSTPSEGSGGGGAGAETAVAAAQNVVPPEELGLPTDEESVIRYLTNSYKGVGEKTAEALVEELGGELFSVLQRQPDRIREVLPANRADQLLDAWRDDLSRRKDRDQEGE